MLQYQQHMSRFPVESSEQTMLLTDMQLVLQVRLHRWRLGRVLNSDAHVSGRVCRHPIQSATLLGD